jgi:hypothetical protein
MAWTTDGAIDCDIHPAVPGMKALLPYLNLITHLAQPPAV